MTALTNVTPVEVTDPRSGETYWRLSRPIIDPNGLWEIFLRHDGRMDLYQVLTALDGRLFDRRGPLSKADINRARNAFRAIEKYGREHGQPCLPILEREDAITQQATYLNKYQNDRDEAQRLGKTPSEYWLRRAKAAATLAARLPRGKTGVRLADTKLAEDVSRLRDVAAINDQISETYGDKSEQYAGTIGLGRDQIKIARQRAAENEEAEKAHAAALDACAEDRAAEDGNLHISKTA